MLSKETVQKMADYFFGGEPEKAYGMIRSLAEWEQFRNSVTDAHTSKRVYDIMRRSDLTIWDANATLPNYANYPLYKGEIKIPNHVE